MTLLLSLGGLGVAIFAGLYLLIRRLRSSARTEGVAVGELQTHAKVDAQVIADNKVTIEQNKATVAAAVKQSEEVNAIHARLDSDPDYAKRVRDKFSRD